MSAVAALYEAHSAGIEGAQTSNLSTIQALALYIADSIKNRLATLFD